MEEHNKHLVHSFRSSAVIGQQADVDQRSQWNTQVAANVPVLFCTSNGLHLRLMSKTNDQNHSTHHMQRNGFNRKTEMHSTSSISNTNVYSIKFCDLERWSTNGSV